MSVKLFGLGDCKVGSLGTEVRDCDIIDRGDWIGIHLLDKSWSKAINENGDIDLTEEKYAVDIKKGLIEPVNGIKNTTDNTPENSMSTDSLGNERISRLGLPKFSGEVWKGGAGHKVMYSKNSFDRYTIALAYTNGMLFAHSRKKDKITGFGLNAFSVDTFKHKQGEDNEKTKFSFQIPDAKQYNERFVFVPYEKLDVEKIKGVINLNINITSATETEFKFKITSAFNSDDQILGLEDEGNFRFIAENTGTPIESIVFDVAKKEYVGTSTGLIDNVQIQTDDGTYNVIEDAAGNLFKGTSNKKKLV